MASDEITQARAEAERQRKQVEDREPLIRAGAQALRWRLAENNLSVRIRAALAGRIDDF